MSELINVNISPHPDHSGINSYGVKYALHSGKEMGPAFVRSFAADLLKAIASECVRLGAVDIGHIKAYIEYGGGFLYADTVGEGAEVVIQGRDAQGINEFTITINAVVVGISEGAVKEATEEVIRSTTNSYAMTKRIIQSYR